MDIVFFGTPNPAVPSLEALVESPHRVVGVVTAPDRPQGRGLKLDAPPVKKFAVARGLPVYQPATVKTPEAQDELREFGADVFVVVAFGLILPKTVLEMTRFGCINVHFSLLPLLRGAAPVQWSLIEGHERTGITIMHLDEGMDTGPMLAKSEEPIFHDDDVESLEQRLSVRGARLLREVVDQIGQGDLDPEPQDDSLATYAPKISGEDAHLDWSEAAEVIRNKVRGLTPRPGAWGVLNGKRLKVWKIGGGGESPAAPHASSPEDGGTRLPGTIHVEKEAVWVETGSRPVELEVVQPEGKSRMSISEFIRGYRPASGDRIL